MIRTQEKDKDSEREVAALMRKRWDCEVQHTGYLDGWDFVGIKNGRTVFIAELKTRNNSSQKYGTVFLSAHKWLALSYASQALGITGLFVVRFKDAVLYQDIGTIDARHHTLAGRSDRPDAPNDQELIIEVPISGMKELGRNG